MAKGILGVIACPMLEDELIWALDNEKDPVNIFVIDNNFNESFRRKMDRHGIPYELISENRFMNDTASFDRNQYNVIVRMKDLALHAEPLILKADIERDLLLLNGCVDAVALYFGICGNHGWDISDWAEDNVDYPVTVFRDEDGCVCDDCVGVAVGGSDGYLRLLNNYAGVMLLTPCIATNWETFFAASDLMKGSDALGTEPKETMKMIFHLCGYEKCVQIDNGLEPREEFDKATKEFAEFNEFQILQASPEFVDLGPMKRLYAESKALLEKD